MRQEGLRLHAKQLFDRTVATFALVASAPLLAAASAAVGVSLGRPILFRQVRPGRGGEPIRLYKLRTMTDARGPDGALLPDEQRLGTLGRFLRATSMDDLPNLFNVLKGELSLVGPRPLLTSYLPLYNEEQARRHDVLPGITGWAQTHGRNAISHEERFRLDLWYVDNWSLRLDLVILVRTVGAVLRRRGISSAAHATKDVWQGNTNAQ